MHNIETDYYSSLARIEKKYLKKLYFISEAKKLSSFQKELQKADTIFSISEKDKETLLQYNNHVVTIPAFHQFKEVNVSSSNDIFALYHGNLAVGENNEAALYLVNQVFNDIPLKLVISGSNPSSELKKAVQKFNNITLVCNNDYQQVNELIKSAAINVLPTFQSTGVKLKLLNALFLGKHCLVNDYMVSGSGLNSLCVIANTPSEWKEYLKKLFNQPFDNTEIEKRNLLLLSLYNNKQNAQKLIETIFG
ncbi:MAG: glycosyltransferase [Bacteroidia bacterium]|nr:glycosyltransferase [Bacteroidia bacterium]